MGRPRTTRTSDQVTIRLPDGMRDELNRLAAANGRSANAEIVARLQASLSPTDNPEVGVIRDMVREELERALAPLLEKRKR